MSTHSIEIVEITHIDVHPNADALAITHVDGWQCCIAKDQFKVGDKAVYIPPDYVCKLSHPAFAFLKKDESKTFERIKVRRLRGQLSQGLLIPVPMELGDLPVGTNVIDQLGVERYEPPVPASSGGNFVTPPSLYAPKFDIESFQKFMILFATGEPVVISEKLHGCVQENTPVMLANGEYWPIKGLSVGDSILSYDEQSDAFVPDSIVDIFHRTLDKKWVRLTLDSAIIECTEDHKFLTDRGWVDAKDLTEKDEIISIK